MKDNNVYPIAIGTYNLGKYSNKIFDSLDYSQKFGQNYIDISSVYDKGRNLPVIAEFIEKSKRENLFINVKLENYIHNEKDIDKQIENYLMVLHNDYIDSVQLHTSHVSKISLLEIYSKLNELKKEGIVRNLGVGNASFSELKEIGNSYEIYNFEGVYNFECREYEKNGVLNYCKEHNIKFFAYQAIRRNKTSQRGYFELENICKKYKRTANEIIINWMVYEKNIIPIIKSTDKKHIELNNNALKFRMEKNDIDKLNRFRNRELENIEIDWDSENGLQIYQLPNLYR